MPGPGIYVDSPMSRTRLSEDSEDIESPSRKVRLMLFFIVVVGALIVWAVVAAALASSHDGPAAPHSDSRSVDERRGDFALLTDSSFFSR